MPGSHEPMSLFIFVFCCLFVFSIPNDTNDWTPSRLAGRTVAVQWVNRVRNIFQILFVVACISHISAFRQWWVVHCSIGTNNKVRGDGRDAKCCIPATHECHRFGARDVLFVEIIWRGVRFAINHHQIRSRFGFIGAHKMCLCAIASFTPFRVRRLVCSHKWFTLLFGCCWIWICRAIYDI